ncbi:MAG: hypothetical protein IJ745_05490 [Bacteroidales bacterium]|nr:hypothetical protein [Bacteroidales bacterium]
MTTTNKTLKLRNFFLFAILSAFIVFSACSGDEDENIAAEVAGTYEGTLKMSVSGRETDSFTTTITIREQSSSTVSIVLPELPGSHGNVPEMELKGVSVRHDGDGIYSLSKSTAVTLLDVNYAITLSGTHTDQATTLQYAVAPEGMPMPIEILFESR